MEICKVLFCNSNHPNRHAEWSDVDKLVENWLLWCYRRVSIELDNHLNIIKKWTSVWRGKWQLIVIFVLKLNSPMIELC